ISVKNRTNSPGGCFSLTSLAMSTLPHPCMSSLPPWYSLAQPQHIHGAIGVSRQQMSAIWPEAQRTTQVGKPPKPPGSQADRLPTFPRGRVPQLDRTVLVGRGQGLAIRAERQLDQVGHLGVATVVRASGQVEETQPRITGPASQERTAWLECQSQLHC